MKIPYYFGLFVLLCANVSNSYSSYSSTNLVEQIKPNPTVGSKPTASYTKIASVSFLPEYSGYKVGFGCDEGYTLVNGKCEPNTCEGYPYEDATLVANCTASESCKSGNGYKYKCTTCKDGLSLSGGGCSCDLSLYPYDEVNNPCPYLYDNETSSTCSEINANGTKRVHYAGCKCPESWQKCDGEHQKGLGTACESYGEKSYYNCGCQEVYNKTCLDSRPTDSGDYCLNLSDGVRYYDECYSCNLSQGEVYNYDEYWCDLEWVEFPVIGNLFEGD